VVDLFRIASAKVQTGKRPRKCRKAVLFQKEQQDAFQPPRGALVTMLVI
jgi:hypothetical protein